MLCSSNESVTVSMLKINTPKVKLTEIQPPSWLFQLVLFLLWHIKACSCLTKKKKYIITIREIKVNFFALKVELMTKEKTKQKLSLQQLVSSHVTNMHLTDMYVSWEMCCMPAVNSSEVKMMQLTDYYVNILSLGNV